MVEEENNIMAGYEQTIIVGNVGREPEARALPSGAQVTSFSVAVTRKWKDRQTNEQRENTNWYRVSCWGTLAEIAKNFVRKGAQIMVVGTVTANAYTSQDGQSRATLELRADNFQLLGSRADNLSEGGQGGSSYDDFSPPQSSEEIPF
jgi:single-strand DNA-binding protein